MINPKARTPAGAGEDGSGAAHAASLRLAMSITRVHDKP